MSYQLFHPLDRPGQPEAMEWILASDKKFNILCAPTGFGKSPLAATASLDYRTLALVLHKSLQSANYQDQYDFEVLFGKSNYPCIEKNEKAKLQASFLDLPSYTAYDCSNPDCNCPYQKQEMICLNSDRVSLNYAKYLMSRPLVENLGTEYLFLDEAHNLPNITMDFVGFSLDWDNEFLQSNGRIKPVDNMRLNLFEAMTLFRQCARAIENNKPEQKEDLKRWRKWKRLHQKIKMTNAIVLSSNMLDWYFETDEKSLIIKPLTAKYHFKRLFGQADKVILMSATIKPSIAERLGLEDSEWDYHEVPNSWPIPSRLVYDLGGPAINYKSSDEDKLENAKRIASVLKPDKSGIIHVTSKSQANSLQYLLSKILRQQRNIGFHIPTTEYSTGEQYNEWKEKSTPGVYCISWNFHEGVDLGFNDISIIAKVPWINFSSNYETARMEYDQKWYIEQGAMKFEQACGRPRRGKPEHYLPGAKLIYIADSSYHRLKTSLSPDFRMSIRKHI